jgi:hypothetical protein
LADSDSVAAFIGAPPQAARVMSRDVRPSSGEEEIEEARKLLTSIGLLEADLHRAADKIDLAWTALQEASRWESKPGETTLAINIALYEAEGLFGLALTTLDERLKENPFDRKLLEQRIGYYHKLGWEQFAGNESSKLALRKANQARLQSIKGKAINPEQAKAD